MKSVFRFFASNHIFATLFTIMILLLGFYSTLTIKRDLYPHVDFGMVEITTSYPGASPEDVELNVTNKIEDELKSIAGIDKITSTSLENMSHISVTIKPDVKDSDKVKDDIHKAVDRITDFPEDVTETPMVIDVDTSWIDIIEVGISGDLPYRELREIAKRFEKKLKAIDGVKMLSSYGYRAKEIKIEVSPEKMHEYQIPLTMIMDAIGARNIRMTGGSFESYTDKMSVVTLAQFKNINAVNDVIIRKQFNGPSVKIKDLAIVKEDFEKETIISHMQGRKAISFIIFKSPEADIIRTVRAIKKLIKKETELQKFINLDNDQTKKSNIFSFLKKDKTNIEGINWYKYGNIRVLYATDLSVYVENRFRIVTSNGIIGFILVLIILSIFLHKRTAVWVALGIPVSVLGVVFLLPFFGAFLDVLSLSSIILVLGIIVDDAIIISENINRKRELGLPPLDAAVEGVSEVFAPVVTTVLTTFLVFLPMFFMTGMLGKFVYVIPLVVSLALFLSLFESTFFLPAHIARGFEKSSKKTNKAPEYQWFNKLRDGFKKLSLKILKIRYLLVIIFFIIFILAILFAAKFMEFILFPSESSDYITINIELPPGVSLEATEKKVIEIENIIKELPDTELQTFISRTGKIYDGGLGENYAYIQIGLTPYSKRTRTAHQIVEKLKEQSNPIKENAKLIFVVEGGGPPVGKPISLRIIGSNDKIRKKLADRVEMFLTKQNGVKDISRDDKYGKDQIEVDIDFEELANLGLRVSDVAQNIRIAYDGQIVTSIRDGDEDVDFRVILEKEARKDINYLNNLSIPNNQGKLVRLGNVASLKTGPGPSSYKHFDGERAITIEGDIDKDVTTPVIATQNVLKNFNLEKDWPGMKIIVSGEAQESEKAMINLFGTFVIALLGVYFLLVILFKSYTQPFFVLIAIPFGFVGVVFAFAIHREPLGFFAIIGTIGLVGVVVNDSLVLVDHLNALIKKNPKVNFLELVAEGTSNRLRAILLTTITTVCGLLPLAYGIGGIDEWVAPMALSLGYGLLFATPLTLCLVPCLYAIRNDILSFFSIMKEKPKKKKIKKEKKIKTTIKGKKK